ncbi:MAG: leucine-rich repeat protein [Ruminococcus sp.]|nr:leucine-rich repeat protein [Ruminococcus sp.]
MKKFISVLLSALLITSVIYSAPFVVSAAEADDETSIAASFENEDETVGASSGTTGDCTWTLDSNGVLTISGNGEMDDFSYKYNSQYDSSITTAPWGASIKSVVIENGVTSIGKYAFYGCKGLTSVTIPDGVTSIGSGAFDNTGWYNNQPDGLIYAGKFAYKYKGEMPNNTSIVIKEGTKGIADHAFRGCTSLTSVTIPDSVTRIGGEAFAVCTGLTSVTIPDSVTSIGGYAFAGCTGLTSVTIPDSVTSIGDNAFAECTGLTSVTIGNGVTSIGGYAFYGCTGLTNVNIPDSVTSIGYRAFSDCASLTSITIPDNVTSIGDFVFSKCSEDLIINCNPGSVAEEYARKNNIKTNIQEFKYEILDDGTVEVTEYLDSFNDIIIPSKYKGVPVTSIKNWLFANNTKIQSVTIPDSVTKIGKGAFYNCVELKTVTMGNNVTEIGANAFEKCLYLENINLSDNLQTIGDEAFYDCRRLKKLDIPATVTSIGEEAFTNCRSLTSLTIPKGVDKIGDESSLGYGMFENCQNLTEVTIPKTVSYIQSNAFDGCKNLTILGSSNSYAKSFAENNNIKFRAIAEDMPIGDANGDNTVDVLDAAAIQKHASGISELNSDQLVAADVNGDGNVDVLDAAEIQKFAAGKITEFKKKA